MEQDVDTEESFKAVKMTLNTFCCNDDLKTRVNEFVLNANKIMFEAYSLANLHIIKLINQNKIIPKLDQDFFQNCCQFVTTMYERRGNNPDNLSLQNTFDLYSELRPAIFKPAFRDYNGILMNYIAKDMFVATKNHLVLNFYTRFTKFIKLKYNLTGEQTYKLIKEIYNEKYKGNNIIIQKWRDRLSNLPPTEKNIKNNPTFILSVYNEILNFFNNYNLDKNKKAIRIFSLLPNKNSFTISNITIDKSVLKDIVLSFKKKKCDNDTINTIIKQETKTITSQFKNEPKKYWIKFFNIKNLDTFSGIIKTDGNSVSVLYDVDRKIVSKKKKNLKGISTEINNYDVSKLQIKNFDIIEAYDPGFRFMCVGTNSYEKKENDITQCSSKIYYHNCKINKANIQKKIMYKKNIYIDTFFKGMPSNKTNNIELYSSYITYVLNGLTKCLKFHFEKPFRKLKFTTYIFKQKTMNELCKQITKKSNINDNKKVLIGFGNWSSQKDSIIRGHRRGPVVGLKRELKKWCKLVLVDEYNTSKLCCKCHTKTEKISYNNIKINSVLRCTNNECRIVIDRDINGCKNIYNIFKRALEKKSRPKAFCRETNTS
jgi:hypothetical protein